MLEFIASIRIALLTLPTYEARKSFIGHAYKELVGYDPFEDDATMSLADGVALYCGVVAETLAAEGKRP
ncbi:hypothetical protein [Mesorhizobium sp.]|uniref:hypothetical protein n=1 Tax=Mesorhizobium sp. TaxID=1871066 RepID=UPI000FE9A4AB|nr:hypothetical protein [Mesorhizobium sp.]RWE37429.1 MAG: hypothetical protein EOS77_02295 [Mesorhizobium sp.]